MRTIIMGYYGNYVSTNGDMMGISWDIWSTIVGTSTMRPVQWTPHSWLRRVTHLRVGEIPMRDLDLANRWLSRHPWPQILLQLWTPDFLSIYYFTLYIYSIYIYMVLGIINMILYMYIYICIYICIYIYICIHIIFIHVTHKQLYSNYHSMWNHIYIYT